MQIKQFKFPIKHLKKIAIYYFILADEIYLLFFIGDVNFVYVYYIRIVNIVLFLAYLYIFLLLNFYRQI